MEYFCLAILNGRQVITKGIVIQNRVEKTKKESIIADELFLVTPTGFKPVTF